MINPMHNDDQAPSNDDPSLSITDAARRLSVSPATIRRHIKERKIAAFQRPTERGFEWRVLPDQPVGNVDHIVDQLLHIDAQEVIIDVQNDDQPAINDDQEDETDQESIADVVTAVIAELREEYRDRIAELEEKNERNLAAAAHWQARAQEQERRAIHAEEQVRLLMAPKDEPEPPEPEPPIVEVPRPRAWWRRLFGDV